MPQCQEMTNQHAEMNQIQSSHFGLSLQESSDLPSPSSFMAG